MDASSNSSYQCHAVHDSLPGGKASGRISLSHAGVRYQVGELEGSLPFTQLQFSLGGAGNRLVFIKHPAMADLTLYTSDLSILKNPIVLAHPEAARRLGCLGRRGLVDCRYTCVAGFQHGAVYRFCGAPGAGKLGDKTGRKCLCPISHQPQTHAARLIRCALKTLG